MNDFPNNYTFDELFVGQNESFRITISDTMVNKFAKISGDFNPLHMDENFARKSSFGRRICHGMLLSSFFSQLVGMHLPGKNALYFSQNINFRLPCFIGDEVLVKGKIIEISNATKMISVETSILNQSGECLIDGIAQIIVR